MCGQGNIPVASRLWVKLVLNPLKGFLCDFVEYEHNEGDNDSQKIPQYYKTE